MTTTDSHTVETPLMPLREHVRHCDQCRNQSLAIDMCDEGQRILLKTLHQLLYDDHACVEP